MSAGEKEIERVWHAIVALVMETRGDWRKAVVEATGLPFTRTRALRRLARGEMTLRELADSMATDAPAATVTVNDLEARGLVARREHPEDRRAKLVSLTAAGRALVKKEKGVPDPVPGVLEGLEEREVKVLAKIFAGGRGKGGG